MPNAINPAEISRVLGTPVVQIPQPVTPPVTSTGENFRETLLNSLEEVNKLQMEAAQGIEKLATGETDNFAEVFSTVRKADVAFSMLMEMRNKLIDAYREVQQMRV